MAKENHPDTHPGDKAKESKFKDITTAYETLSDPAKRKAYDGKDADRVKQTGRQKNVPKSPFDFAMNFDDMFGDTFEEPVKEKAPPKTGDFINADEMFSKFMGYKPR